MRLLQKLLTGTAEALEARQVRVICSTDGMDRGGDVVVQEGIDLSAYKANPVVLWQHDPDEPISRALDIGVQGGKLQSLVQFPEPGVSAAADKAYGLIKAGIINAVSIGFLPVESEPIDPAKPWAGKRFLKSELLEFSFVSIPANQGALIVGRSVVSKEQRRLTLKGLYEVSWLASILSELDCLAGWVEWEAAIEEDGSNVPAMLAYALQQLGQALIAMTAEEVAELLADHDAGNEEGAGDAGDVVQRRVKAFRAALKAGKVLSAANVKRLGDAMEHHEAMGACVKAVLEEATTDEGGGEEAASDDTEKALRAREAEALALSVA